MKTYTVEARRDEGGWWVVSVPELDGVFTQSRRLNQVEDLVRDAIALWLEKPAESFEVDVKASVPELDDRIAEVEHARREADRLREEAGTRSRNIARDLAERGLTVRDIGQVLGISHQRAAQLLEEKKPAARRARQEPGKRVLVVGKVTRSGRPPARKKAATQKQSGAR